MKGRIFLCVLGLLCLAMPASAAPIRWVNFEIPRESMEYAMKTDIASAEGAQPLSWIDILALSASRTGGKCPLHSVRQAAQELKAGFSPDEIPEKQRKLFLYYRRACSAVLGGFLGHYSITVQGEEKPCYGLKAFSPIAEGWSYSHYDDFGAGRSFGFRRKHLGNDLMGKEGTPIVAVEGGVVEAMGWNRYGGWRVGIRSFDGKRYFYYAHLQKDHPFAPGLKQGDTVQAGDLIGFMGRTGYSDQENTSNIETVHLHFGMQLIFDESQKECDSEIWIDVYEIVKLLSSHRSTVVKTAEGWKRAYPFRDLDWQDYPRA